MTRSVLTVLAKRLPRLFFPPPHTHTRCELVLCQTSGNTPKWNRPPTGTSEGDYCEGFTVHSDRQRDDVGSRLG